MEEDFLNNQDSWTLQNEGSTRLLGASGMVRRNTKRLFYIQIGRTAGTLLPN